MTRPEPVFEAPWHAQVFAVTVHLNEQGHFEWRDWATRFGATLKDHGKAQDLNGGDDYFLAWVATLEQLLSDLGLADAPELVLLKDAWREAYLRTPHGAPVHLDD